MFLNYILIGIRNILKYKVFSFINLFGLAMGMTVCMLIILMLADQKKYDQFHTNKERIYRVLSHADYNPLPFATAPYPTASTLKNDYPFVEESTQIMIGVGGEATYNEKTMEMRGFFADDAFFKIFSFDLGRGDENTALQAPNSMVISDDMARLLFGNEDPIGKTIDFVDRGLHYLEDKNETAPVDWGKFTITGVMSDEKVKSHLKFDVLVSSSSRNVLIQEKKIRDYNTNWQNYDYTFTYVLLNEGKNGDDLDAALSDIINDQYAGKYADNKDLIGFNMTSQKLTRITPGKFCSYPTSYRVPIEAYYFVSFIALIIMLSACLNYANLSTSRALLRAKEIGVRKAAGATRQQLVIQFLGESVIASLFALVVAVLLLYFVKSAFVDLGVNNFLDFDLQQNISVYLIFVLFAIMVGLIAGTYPAIYLSKFQPAETLGNDKNMKSRKFGWKNILNVSQFVISLFFIITSILLYNQLKHYLKFDYAFNSENIVNIDLRGNNYQVQE